MILLSPVCVISHLICDRNYAWQLKLNLIFTTLDWNRKWLVDFNAGKTQLVLFDWSNNIGAIDVKISESVLDSFYEDFSPEVILHLYVSQYSLV